MGAQPGVTGAPAMERNGDLVHGGLLLPRASTLRVEDGREMLVCVRSGCVWITQERERRDTILESGEEFRITRDRRTLITALGRSVIALRSPYGKPVPRRIELVRPGAARPLVVYEGGRGVRGRLAALRTLLTDIWLGLYAPPSRRVGPFV